MTQSRRIAACSTVTVVLLLVDVLGSLGAFSGEAVSLAGEGLTGEGIGAVLTVLLALAITDAAAAQRGLPDGVDRGRLLKVCLLGLVWSAWRVAHGDPWIVPAATGLMFVAFQASLFKVAQNEDEEPEDAADPRADATDPVPPAADAVSGPSSAVPPGPEPSEN